MRGLVLFAPALALALTGCGGGPAGPAPHPASSAPDKAAPSTPKASPTPSPTHREKATSNVHACYDGTCLLKVRGPKTIPLDAKKLHYPQLEVKDVTSSGLKWSVRTESGGSMSGLVSPGGEPGGWYEDGSGSSRALSISVLSIERGTALLSLQAKRHL